MDPLDALRRETARYGYGLWLGCSDEAGRGAFAQPERGLLAIGPARSGKTSSIVVPNTLAACGPVISTSTKPDVLATTAPARSRVGDCMMFDPSGRTRAPAGVKQVGWSPLETSIEWDGANSMAEALVLSARPGSSRGEALHWSERAQALLAPAFHAAALDEMPMARLVSAVDRRQGSQLRAVLARHDTTIALDTIDGVLATEEREQSGIWSTASSILAAYRSERALSATSGERIDFDAFVRSGDSLYICAGSEDQRHSAPLVSGLVREARLAGYRAAAAGELGYAHRRPPLLLVLDEVANIAPLHDLPALVSEGGSQGVITIACLQDLTQASDRWGRAGEGFLSLFNTKVVFPGIGDTRTLEALSLLAGERDVLAVSESEGHRLPGIAGMLGRRGSSQRTYSTRKERCLPVALIAQGVPGHAVCLEGAVPALVKARAWFDVPQLREAVTACGIERGAHARGTHARLGP